MKYIRNLSIIIAMICLSVGARASDTLPSFTTEDIEEITVTTFAKGNYVSSTALAKSEVISFAGLCKMACCNLAETFENSASVTVGYSDAISGSRQIKMLGLAGTYTQVLDENRPIMQGISAPYALNYIPGMWLNSIQVSKGISSVTAGHEAITGQINLDFRKPTDEEKLFVNLFLNNELRPEINLSTAQRINDKLSTVVLIHASGDTNIINTDHNNDGFRDMPSTLQLNFANRWLYQGGDGLQVRWGVNAVRDSRLSGMTSYNKSMKNSMLELNIYGAEVKNTGAGAYLKIGKPVGEKGSSLAIVTDWEYFNEDAYFGLNDYYGNENTMSLKAMYNHSFTPRSSLALGLASSYSILDEKLNNGLADKYYDFSEKSAEVGIYGEYTYNMDRKFSLVAGSRLDYNTSYDKFLFTPRGQLKYSPSKGLTLRASLGLGFRSSNIITDNIGMLATGRELIFSENINSLEKALTLGGSVTQNFTLRRHNDATISFDYFRTEFFNNIVVDQQRTASEIYIYNSDKKSFTDNYQVDFSWTAAKGLDIFATYRHTFAKESISRANGDWVLTDKAMVSRFKGLLNIQYATNYKRWIFDVTAQINGDMLLPTQDGDLNNVAQSPIYPMFYAQVTRKIRQWDIYVGCENIANYKQENPIISTDEPFSPEFNSSLIWGSISGRKFYLGLRFNLY